MRAALLTLLLLLPALAEALPPKTWIVSVGNNQGDKDEVELLYAEHDARSMVEVLQRHGGIRSRRTSILVNEPAESVRAALLHTNAMIREATRNEAESASALIVFYSGHADATALHMNGSHLPLEELKNLVAGSAAGLRLLVVDACRSGAVTRVKGVRPAASFAIKFEDQVAATGTAIITSSAAGEASQESDTLQASYFTHHLINALRGAADENADGRVTLAEAYAYTYSQTLRSSGRTLRLQHPTFAYDVKGRGAVVLSTPGEENRRAGRLRLAEPAVYLISEQRKGGAVVAEVSPPKAKATLALPAGSYFIQQRLPHELREFQARLKGGEEIKLKKLPFQAIKYDRLVRARGGVSRSAHGLTLMAASRGEIVKGDQGEGHLILGYRLDLPALSLGLRVRGGLVDARSADPMTLRRREVYAAGLTLQRFIDLEHFSLSFGLALDGELHRQVFTGEREIPERRSGAMSFGGLFSVERQLGPMALRLEGGPATLLFKEQPPADAPHPEAKVETQLTWWLGLGGVWRL